jgi:hypothetical protein
MVDTYYVTVDEDVHEVQCDGGGFRCNDCEAADYGDGYLCSESGAQEWHDSL